MTKRLGLLAVIAAGCSAGAHAATVRGTAVCVAGNQRSPARNMLMTVFNARIGRSNRMPVGADGAFFLYNIPAGSYVLEAWSKLNPSQPPTVFQINIAEPVTQLPPVTLTC